MATKGVGTANVSSVLETRVTRDAGACDCEGTDLDAPEGVPPGGVGVLGCLKAVTEKGRGWQLDLVEARHQEVEGRCAAAKWQADGDDGAEKPLLHDLRRCGPGQMGSGDKNVADRPVSML